MYSCYIAEVCKGEWENKWVITSRILVVYHTDHNNMPSDPEVSLHDAQDSPVTSHWMLLSMDLSHRSTYQLRHGSICWIWALPFYHSFRQCFSQLIKLPMLLLHVITAKIKETCSFKGSEIATFQGVSLVEAEEALMPLGKATHHSVIQLGSVYQNN